MNENKRNSTHFTYIAFSFLSPRANRFSRGHTNKSTGEYHFHGGGSEKSITPKSLKKNEAYYQNIWAREVGGETEVTMPDGTRCDIVTDTHAIEVDWGKKWAEAIGQSLNYSMQTGKRAGILLILKTESDYKYWVRLNSIIEHHRLPIDTWFVRGDY